MICDTISRNKQSTLVQYFNNDSSSINEGSFFLPPQFGLESKQWRHKPMHLNKCYLPGLFKPCTFFVRPTNHFRVTSMVWCSLLNESPGNRYFSPLGNHQHILILMSKKQYFNPHMTILKPIIANCEQNHMKFNFENIFRFTQRASICAKGRNILLWMLQMEIFMPSNFYVLPTVHQSGTLKARSERGFTHEIETQVYDSYLRT